MPIVDRGTHLAVQTHALQYALGNEVMKQHSGLISEDPRNTVWPFIHFETKSYDSMDVPCPRR